MFDAVVVMVASTVLWPWQRNGNAMATRMVLKITRVFNGNVYDDAHRVLRECLMMPTAS